MAIKIARVQTEDRLINQLQQNIAGALEPVFQNLSGSFITVLSGCTSSPTGKVYWQRATNLGPVTLVIPGIQGTSNATTATLSNLPSNIWPLVQQEVLLVTRDNGTFNVSFVTIDPTGVITIYKDISRSAFTASGTKGLAPCNITYVMTN